MNSVVYYPHFWPSPNWLKVGALCWDRIYRLRTFDAPADPEPIRELDEALGGLLGDVQVEEVADRHEVLEGFTAWLEANSDKVGKVDEERNPRVALFSSKFPGELRGLFSRLGFLKVDEGDELEIPSWERVSWESELMEMRDSIAVEPPVDSAHGRYLRLMAGADEHRARGDLDEEMAARAAAEAISAANLTKVRGPSRYYLPRDVALYYLSRCAGQMATDRRMDLAAGQSGFPDPIFHEYASAGTLMTGIVEAYLPERIEEIEPKRIADLRVELAASRLRFQKAVQDHVQHFATVASEGEFESLKAGLLQDAQEQADNTRRKYRKAKIDLASKTLAFTITPPALIDGISSTLSTGLLLPAGVAVALGLATWNKFLEWQEARADRREGPFSYVLEVKEHL